MGGSLGLDLKNLYPQYDIFGCDHNSLHVKIALELNLIDSVVSIEDIITCDIIFLTIPVEAIIKTLSKLENIDTFTTLIDFGGTKEKW